MKDWAQALIARSVLKKRKLRELETSLGETSGLRCLDLGSDNGVISLLLRRRGGSWASADLTDESVASIRALVGEDVHKTDGRRLPFADASFDRVAIVDMLEHVPDEQAFAAEIARVCRPGARLVINTPHLRHTLLRRFRHALGQTDEKHGHVRPGYTVDQVTALFGPAFSLDGHRTYSRFFSELVDTVVNLGVAGIGKKGSAKGMVVTGADLARHGRAFRFYAAVYPLLAAVAALDALIPFVPGYMLIATAHKRREG
jgi:ubiquinone/menaquinone biosynthesis C-methylase UbiE